MDSDDETPNDLKSPFTSDRIALSKRDTRRVLDLLENPPNPLRS